MHRVLVGSLLVSVLWLGGCGGGAERTSPQSTAGDEASSASRGPEGCTGHDASQEALCVAHGCRWGQALLCMGTAHADDQALPPRPCTCVCAEDELECSMVPSAAPAQ